MAPLRAAARSTVRNGALLWIIGSLLLVGCGESAFGQGVVRSPTSVSTPPKIEVTVSVGGKETDAVVASPLIVQYDRSRLISRAFKARDSSILEVSKRDTRLEISAPAIPQFVQIESATGISTNNEPIGKSVIDRCGPSPALDLLSRWKWNIAIPPNRFRSPYLVVYVRWVTNRKNGPSVIYLGLWSVLVQRRAQNTVTYGDQ
jgi:hypothetical protein